MTSSEILNAFVVKYATEVAGFTSAEVRQNPASDRYEIRLDDETVDEHALFTVSHRDLLVREPREAVLRMLAYQIDVARREVVRRVTGEVTP